MKNQKKRITWVVEKRKLSDLKPHSKNPMKGKIFNAQEVQAILDGSKVMFREVVKPKPLIKKNDDYLFDDKGKLVFQKECCPYQVGQKIFCKESFYNPFVNTYYAVDDLPELRYAKWKPAQHMKQEHSRLTLLIKEIKVERLADISEEDAIAEGFAKITKDGSLYKYGIPDRDGLPGTNDFGWAWADWQKTAKEAFAVFWNATHKKPEDKFEANPWVWCVSFEVINN